MISDQGDLREKLEDIANQHMTLIKQCSDEKQLKEKVEEIKDKLTTSIRDSLSYEELITITALHVSEECIKNTLREGLAFVLSRDE